MDDMMDGIAVPGIRLQRRTKDTLVVFFHPPRHYNGMKWKEALQESACIETVHIEGTCVHPGLFRQPRHKSVAKFMTALFSLPKLTSCQFLYWRQHDTNHASNREIPVALVSFVLRHAIGLQSFCGIHRRYLVGANAEFEELARCLEGHKALSSFSLPDFHSTRLLRAFSHMPQLKSLVLHKTPRVKLDPSALGCILSNPCLDFVSLDGFRLDEHLVSAIVQNLRHRDPSKPLRTLVLKNFGSFAATAAVASLLSANSPLQELNLSMFTCSLMNKQEEAIRQFFQALRSNSNLRVLKVSKMEDRSSFSEHLWDPLLFLLKSNTTLERVCIEDFVRRKASFTTFHNPKAEHLLKLNRLGRGMVLKQGATLSREEWIQKLAMCENDLDCLYYFLSLNPSLCQGPLV